MKQNYHNKISKVLYFLFFIVSLFLAALIIIKYGSNILAVIGAAMLLFAAAYLFMSHIQEDIIKRAEKKYKMKEKDKS